MWKAEDRWVILCCEVKRNRKVNDVNQPGKWNRESIEKNRESITCVAQAYNPSVTATITSWHTLCGSGRPAAYPAAAVWSRLVRH